MPPGEKGGLLEGSPATPLAVGRLLIRELPSDYGYSVWASRLLEKEIRPFRKVIVDDGSFALSVMRLLKGEAVGLLMTRRAQKPWDILPPLGFLQRLGYCMFLVVPGGLRRCSFPVTLESYALAGEVLIIHKNQVNELSEWEKRLKKNLNKK
jgi:fructose-1,6-bisphosphatase/inositol monophosphatase family enzyme